MSKDYFQPHHMKSLDDIASNGSIHFIGVCGVAMGQLAVALSKKGFRVSGSDKEFYEPMGSFLKDSSVTLLKGYKTDNIGKDIDLVVIGNAISYEHPEVQEVEARKLQYTCFPKLLAETVIRDKHSIVACGTHGKSTTSAMIASTLNKIGVDPSYFIGGVTSELPTSLYEGMGELSVVEGDEYDDVFFSKRPKFTHYKSQTCIINAIEFDHADLYSDLEVINREFSSLVHSLPTEGKAIVCVDYENLSQLLVEWRKTARCRIITFGTDPSADYHIVDRTQHGLSQTFTVNAYNKEKFEIKIELPALYNALNALASLIACKENSIPLPDVIKALSSFKSVKRRQEIKFSNNEITVIEDFAHHPTSVKATIAAIKESFPDKVLWAVFEPRSNTSRRKIFEQEYIEAFQLSDSSIIANVKARSGVDSGQELLDVSELAKTITKSGANCLAMENDPEVMSKYLLEHVPQNSVVLVMSNGSFGGLIESYVGRLSEKK